MAAGLNPPLTTLVKAMLQDRREADAIHKP